MLLKRLNLHNAIKSATHIRNNHNATNIMKDSLKKFNFKKYFKYGLTITAVGGGTFFVYEIYSARYPPEQFAFDESKKTLAVLGSGWAATSFLKDLDTENFNVIVVSPRNYFLFTPLLPSCTVGTIELRSIMQPIRYLTRFKKREVMFVEADCDTIDPVAKTLFIRDTSEVIGSVSEQTIKYDYLVVACGAQNATFNIPGVKEHACFLKESWDAKKIRTRLMDCIESAAFPGQTEEEMKRLLHMVVVGGGPTGNV
jgi:NADH:ubiquinone reductase (non-electrogenic)